MGQECILTNTWFPVRVRMPRVKMVAEDNHLNIILRQNCVVRIGLKSHLLKTIFLGRTPRLLQRRAYDAHGCQPSVSTLSDPLTRLLNPRPEGRTPHPDFLSDQCFCLFHLGSHVPVHSTA
jgi:hypothetical protein